MNVGKAHRPSMRAPGKGEGRRDTTAHQGNRADRSAADDINMDWIGGPAGTHERR